MNKLFKQGKDILTSQQNSILSAASIITVMIIFSQVFGLIRQWTILKYLGKDSFSLFMAAFRLPDLVFEVFAYGAFSSAFIPVFSKYLKKDSKLAWDTASRVINFGLIIFLFFALIFGLFSYQFYSFVALGFNTTQTLLVSKVARIIFLAEGLFIISYIVTGVLESSRRFFVPALAPVFYNIGIIVGTVLFANKFGIFAPAFGVVLGAFFHLGIQLPVAFKLGFRFTSSVTPNEGVKEVGKLAAPRILDLASLQVQKSAELFFSSIVSIASYGFLSLAYSLQAIPTTLFGVSLAKAALVTLSHQNKLREFRRTFFSTLNQMMFMVVPIAALLLVLRVPIVRLTYGTSRSLDWNATVQIGLVLSGFALGIPLQGALSLLSRAFYARQDTKTPVMLAIFDVVLTLILESVFILVMHLPLWSIAIANTAAAFFQTVILFYILCRKIKSRILSHLTPTFKAIAFSTIASSIAFFTLKFFDRSVWIKRLSFLNGVSLDIPFERFVIDTRYTANLIVLTVIVAVIDVGIYLLLSWLFKSRELSNLFKLFGGKKAVLPAVKEEAIIPPAEDQAQ